MTTNTLRDLLDHILQAAQDACNFTRELSFTEFEKDKKTQQAAIMSLIIIGEAATKIMDKYEEFTDNNPQVKWRSMRGLRNRMAHGYFDIYLLLVWDTVQIALPELILHVSQLHENL